MNIKVKGNKNTKINIKILYEIILIFLCFHSIEQPIRPSSKVYCDQPTNGIEAQNNENINDTNMAKDTVFLLIFFIFDGFLST